MSPNDKLFITALALCFVAIVTITMLFLDQPPELTGEQQAQQVLSGYQECYRVYGIGTAQASSCLNTVFKATYGFYP